MGSDRPRLLWVVPTLERGGTEGQIGLLAPRLAEVFQPVVAALYRLGPVAESLKAAGVATRCLGGRSLYDRRLGSALRELYREHRPALVHSFLWDANVWTAWALRREKGLRLVTSRREIGLWRRRRHLWAERWTNRLARRVVVNSEATRRYVCRAESLAPERVALIPNAVDPELYQRTNRQEARRRLDLSEDLLLLGVVASLAEKKGHEDLFEALRHCHSELPPFRLLVIGDGPYRGALEEKARRWNLSEEVHFLGLRNDVPEILPALDSLVHPSRSESLPNAVLEGMAAGLAVIATRVGGTEEAVEPGKTGVLVEPEAPMALAQALRRMARSPEERRALGRTAQAVVRERFSVGQALEALVRLYREILD